MNNAPGGGFQKIGGRRPMLDPDLPRDDKGMVKHSTKKGYQTDVTATADRSEFCALYTTPIFTMPANFLGVTNNRYQHPGGNECRPSSTVWGNNGLLKIHPSLILRKVPVPFLIH